MEIGFFQLIILALIGVILLGPEEVRRLARKMGGWMRDIRKISEEFSRELQREVDAIDRMERQKESGEKNKIEKNVFTNAEPEPPPPADQSQPDSCELGEEVLADPNKANATDSPTETEEAKSAEESKPELKKDEVA